MRQRGFGVILAVLLAFTLATCTSSSNSNSPSSQAPSSPGNNAVPVSVTIHDTPPAGVTILKFEILVTAATLQPSDASQSPVNMLPQPQDVELIHLQSESAVLANLNVPSGMYSGLSATFANPLMTIYNQSAQTYTVGAQSCAPMQVCEVVPTLNQMSVSFTASPFPITLTANSPVVLDMDFNVNASVQNDLSVTPTVSVNQLPAPPSTPVEHMRLIGMVTGVTSPTFMLQSSFDGSISTITTDSNTVYQFGQSCPADNFGCIATGQLLSVKVDVMSGGTLEATEVRLLQMPGLPTFLGTVLSVNAAQNQFQFGLCFSQGPASFNQQFQNAASAVAVTVQLSSSTAFSIDSDDLTLPAGLSFASVSDLVAGQTVLFQPMLPLTVSGTPPNITVTVGATSLELEPSQITAPISAVNASASPANFILSPLPMFYTNAGITQIQVDAVTGTNFQNFSGVSSLSTGQTVSVAGLVFNTATQPTVIADEIRLHQGNQ